MSNEILEIIKDVKEEIEFLKELGVEYLNADFPEFNSTSVIRNAELKSEIPRERLEKFIPTEEILKKIAKPELREEKTKPVSRSDILESSKLSKIQFAKEISTGRDLPRSDQNPERPESATMPKETDLKNSLFGDISETLPESTETLEAIRREIGSDCTRCDLCKQRTQVVNSVGNPQADLMIIGEAPGADEDAQGEPFVGRAGKLLTRIIEAIGLRREDVFIGNINRCRPPGNRQPTIEESAACKPFLLREITVVKPKVIVVLGNTACQNLLETKAGITKLRGNFQDFYGVRVMPTFHPAYLLRDPRKKREVWEDMKKVRDEIERVYSE